MESLSELTPVGFWNYITGYIGALLVILAMFNVWKNKLDTEGEIDNFKKLLPKLNNWSYENFDDWLVMAVGTPVFIFLQTAILYVGARYSEHVITDNESLFYSRIHYFISFGFGVLSQSFGIILISVGSLIFKKLKALMS